MEGAAPLRAVAVPVEVLVANMADTVCPPRAGASSDPLSSLSLTSTAPGWRHQQLEWKSTHDTVLLDVMATSALPPATDVLGEHALSVAGTKTATDEPPQSQVRTFSASRPVVLVITYGGMTIVNSAAGVMRSQSGITPLATSDPTAIFPFGDDVSLSVTCVIPRGVYMVSLAANTEAQSGAFLSDYTDDVFAPSDSGQATRIVHCELSPADSQTVVMVTVDGGPAVSSHVVATTFASDVLPTSPESGREEARRSPPLAAFTASSQTETAVDPNQCPGAALAFSASYALLAGRSETGAALEQSQAPSTGRAFSPNDVVTILQVAGVDDDAPPTQTQWVSTLSGPERHEDVARADGNRLHNRIGNIGLTQALQILGRHVRRGVATVLRLNTDLTDTQIAGIVGVTLRTLERWNEYVFVKQSLRTNHYIHKGYKTADGTIVAVADDVE
jgi:hypothetical protein